MDVVGNVLPWLYTFPTLSSGQRHIEIICRTVFVSSMFGIFLENRVWHLTTVIPSEPSVTENRAGGRSGTEVQGSQSLMYSGSDHRNPKFHSSAGNRKPQCPMPQHPPFFNGFHMNPLLLL